MDERKSCICNGRRERERGETRWMFPKWISGTNYKDKFFCFVFCLEEKDKFKSPTLSWYVPIQTNMYIYSTLHFYVNISLSRFSETFFYLFSFLYFCSDQMKIVWCTLVTKKILLCQNKQAAAGRRRARGWIEERMELVFFFETAKISFISS